jgi:DNA invertase Pin-like site-specific DNA recombinase
MKKLLEYADEGDTVVVWRVDRLGRSLIDVLNTVNMLRNRGGSSSAGSFTTDETINRLGVLIRAFRP